MRLKHLNKKLDSNKEHELLSSNEHGFEVHIKYKGEETISVLNNYTEVHHLYREGKIAFESDFKGRGFTLDVDVIESVDIRLSMEFK